MNTTLLTNPEFKIKIFAKGKERVVRFQQERAQDCFSEATPLLKRHWSEVAYLNGFEIEPELSTYELLENSNRIKTFTARVEGKLIGYAVFFFQRHLHFRTKIFALCDFIFIEKPYRGFGHRFIKWCNDVLFREGADVLYYYVAKQYDYGVILRRQGFSHRDDCYVFQVK